MTTYHARGSSSRRWIVGLVVLALVVGGALGALIARGSHHSSTSPSTTTSGTGISPTTISSSTTTLPVVHTALRITSVSPAAGAVGVSPNAPITVRLSVALAKDSPMPRLTSTSPGSWQAHGDVLTFTQQMDFLPLSEITLTIPGGASGLVATDGAHLPRSVVEQFRVANGSALRLQELLSLLDYSPLRWTPKSAVIASSDTAAQAAALYSPPAGRFSWRDRGWPARLQALWQIGSYNLFTKGLVMSFQADHGRTPDGHVDGGLWSSLLSALAADAKNTGGYNFALANKAAPEMLTIWHNGHVKLRSPANTGIAASPTPDGTFAVYTRLRSQVMRGSNPDGSKYADLVQYIAYFHGNDAVHYMNRADYGIPQSLGCIELPLVDAARVWPYLAYGTLVTVIN